MKKLAESVAVPSKWQQMSLHLDMCLLNWDEHTTIYMQLQGKFAKFPPTDFLHIKCHEFGDFLQSIQIIFQRSYYFQCCSKKPVLNKSRFTRINIACMDAYNLMHYPVETWAAALACCPCLEHFLGKKKTSWTAMQIRTSTTSRSPPRNAIDWLILKRIEMIGLLISAQSINRINREHFNGKIEPL